MADSILSAAHFQDEQAAYAFVESRIWANGRVCPQCGTIDDSGPLKGKSTRVGVYKCYSCRKPFTAKVGTIFEASHIPMRVWLQAIFLIASSKKGISSNQLHRALGVTLKSAWFMSHRVREAMKDGDMERFGAMGGAVEVDETFIGRDYDKKPEGEKRGRGFAHKYKIVSLVDRQKGLSRSIVVDDLKVQTLYSLLSKNISGAAHLMTDEAHQYQILGKLFRDHSQRYVTEFDFRYNHRKANGWTDEQRAEKLLRGVIGKRLTYRTVAC